MMASGDESDYEVNFHSVNIDGADGHQQGQGQQSDRHVMDDVKDQVSKNVTAYMFAAGKEKAKSVLNVYGNIDVLRPYFDVEPHEVRQRLIHSLIPQKPSADVKQKVPRELYGPLMVVFTLIALLLFQMKVAEHTVQEGTLMGSAFGVCFGYWLGVSSLAWVLAYVCNTHITVLQLLSLIGYALFGHCIVLFVSSMFHTGHDHAMFYLLWAIFGGLSSLKLVSVLVSRTAGQSQKLIICGVIVSLHLLFLLYLHFAYHQTVEDLSEVFDKPVAPELAKVEEEHPQDVVKRDLHKAIDNLDEKVAKLPPGVRDQGLRAKGKPNVNKDIPVVAKGDSMIAKGSSLVAKEKPVATNDKAMVAKDPNDVAKDNSYVGNALNNIPESIKYAQEKGEPKKLLEAIKPETYQGQAKPNAVS